MLSLRARAHARTIFPLHAGRNSLSQEKVNIKESLPVCECVFVGGDHLPRPTHFGGSVKGRPKQFCVCWWWSSLTHVVGSVMGRLNTALFVCSVPLPTQPTPPIDPRVLTNLVNSVVLRRGDLNTAVCLYVCGEFTAACVGVACACG